MAYYDETTGTGGAALPAMPGPALGIRPGAGGRPQLGVRQQEPLGRSVSGPAQEPSEQDRIMKMWEDFFAELNAPLDFNDPYVQSILSNAQQSTLQSAGNRGIFGPYSQNLAQQAYIRGAAGLQEGRRGQALSALGGLTNLSQANRAFNYQKAQDQYANQMDLWKFNQGQTQGTTGLIGGGFGAIAGLALGGPLGAAAGYQIGSGIGSQFGSTGAPPPPTFRPGGY